MLKDISNHKISQDVLKNVYTYTRGQTSIDKTTGTAKKESLRNIRVLRRGLVFLCEYSVPEDYEEDFQKCIKALRYIGMNRTRGLGHVKCTIPESSQPRVIPDDITTFHENDYIEYQIRTLSPIIPTLDCRNDYIPAAAMIGSCFNIMGKEYALSIIDGDTIFTNAYISNGIEQFCKNPAFFAKQKEADYDKNGMPVFVFDTDSCNQANPPALAMKNANLSVSADFNSISSLPIYREINYHHQQSQENPGIIDGVNFYQLTSFSENQIFMGRIYGTPENLQKIYNALHSISYQNIGYYRNSGYGRCRIDLQKKSWKQAAENRTDTIAVYLRSPSIIYDKMGMPCTKPQIFADYTNFVIQSETGSGIAKNHDGQYMIQETYLNYTDIAGFNSTWGMNKPVIRAYGEGPVFIFKLEKPVDISNIPPLFISERANEGYGETVIFDYNTIMNAATKPIYITKASENGDLTAHISDESYSWELPSDYTSRQETVRKAIAAAQKNCTDLMSKYGLNPSTIGRLSLMLNESSDYSSFNTTVRQIKDTKKLEKILKWIALDFKEIPEENYRDYFNTLFTQAKYKLRKDEER